MNIKLNKKSTKSLESAYGVCLIMKDWLENVIASCEPDNNCDSDKEILNKCNDFISFYDNDIKHKLI